MPRKRAPASPFPMEVGVAPYAVSVIERSDKQGMVYLRWWKPSKNNHGWQSLKFRLAGRPAEEVAELAARAQAAAQQKYEELSGQRAPTRGRTARLVTLRDAWGIITDPKAGKYPQDSRYRQQLAAALTLAARVLGEDFPFVSLDMASLRSVVRRQADLTMRRGGVGWRPSEIMGTRLLTIATVLKDEGYLPESWHAPSGKAWRAELRSYIEGASKRQLPETARPRYTEEEIDRLHAAAPQVDPRFALMMALGELLRPEQVGRTWRSQISPELDRLRIEGRGKKRGQVMLLTAHERWALVRALEETGPLSYLAVQETAWREHERDYVLFPSRLQGPLTALRAIPGHVKTVNKDQVQKWVRRAEELGQVPHVNGRGWYGMRRRGTDEASEEGLSAAALQNAFGWTSPKMATDVYEDRGRKEALEGARAFREKRQRERAARAGGSEA